MWVESTIIVGEVALITELGLFFAYGFNKRISGYRLGPVTLLFEQPVCNECYLLQIG